MKKLIFIFLIYNTAFAHTAFAQTGKFSVLNVSQKLWLVGKQANGISTDSTSDYGSNTKLISEAAAKAYIRSLIPPVAWKLTGNFVADGNMKIGTTNNYGFHFIGNGAVRMSMSSTGRLGINTSAPASDYLHVNGDVTVDLLKARLGVSVGYYEPQYGYLWDLMGDYGINVRIGTATATASGGQAILNFTSGNDVVTAIPGWRAGLNTSGENNDNFSIDELSSGSFSKRLTIEKSTGNFGFKTNAPTTTVDINDDKFRVRTAKTPASSTATGNAGDICWDANYIYVCTATNTWVRSALTTW